MHFPGPTATKRLRGSLTVEAAMLMPLLVIVLVVFLGLLRFLIGYQVLSSAVYDCADTMADFADLYELLGLGEIHRALSSDSNTASGTSIDAADVSETVLEGLQVPEEQAEVLQPLLSQMIGLLQAGNLKQALAQGVYSLILDQVGIQMAKAWLKQRLAEIPLENMGIKNGFQGISLTGSRFLYSEAGHGALIQLVLSYQPELYPGSSLLSLDSVEITVTVYAFLGSSPFASEGTTTSEQYYQIGQGTKYHSLSCYLIDKKISSLSLQEAQQQGYQSCQRCQSWEESTVWITSGGERYHLATCSYLYPDLTGMTKQEAIEKGLEPCELCQGSGGGFG